MNNNNRNKNNLEISVILPTYNEAENIRELITRIIKCVNNLKEIIIVDDDSPDKTWQIADKVNKNIVKIIRKTNERGLAAAINTGIESSKGNVVVWMDADLSMPPEAIPKLISVLDDCDVSVGSRYAKGAKDRREFIRVITSWMFNYFAYIMLGMKIRDMDSGFVAAKRYVFDKVNMSKKGYGEYCIKIIYDCIKNGYKVKEVPYVFSWRLRGESKTDEKWYSLLKHGLFYGITVLKIRLGMN